MKNYSFFELWSGRHIRRRSRVFRHFLLRERLFPTRLCRHLGCPQRTKIFFCRKQRHISPFIIFEIPFIILSLLNLILSPSCGPLLRNNPGAHNKSMKTFLTENNTHLFTLLEKHGTIFMFSKKIKGLFYKGPFFPKQR